MGQVKIKYITLLILLLNNKINAQTISSVAGNGIGGDGYPATAAYIANPLGLTYDKYKNLYFTESTTHTIRMIDSSGILHTIAGTRSRGYNGDNIAATAAQLDVPAMLAIDTDNNLYFADLNNHRIRKINYISGIIVSIAGNGTATSTGDSGPATSATIYYPQGLCIDRHGNIFIAEVNKIRKIDTRGIITTIAGLGALSPGYSGDGGPATAAKLASYWVDVDDVDNIYIGGAYTVRKVNSAGIITTIAGDSTNAIYNGDGIPATAAHLTPEIVKYDHKRKRLLISDTYGDRVRAIDSNGIIHTIAGNGMNGFSGDGGKPDTARIDHPSGIAIDKCGNIYIGQVNTPRIRKITYDTCLPDLPQENVYVHEHQPIANLSIYPNPTHNELHIEGQNLQSYRLINSMGTVVQQGSLQPGHNSLPTNGLPAGVYIVEVVTGEGVSRGRVVVE